MASILFVRWGEVPLDGQRWRFCIKASLENYSVHHRESCIARKLDSQTKFYKSLTCQARYIYDGLKSAEIRNIAKARCDVLGLNENKFRGSKQCELCTLNEDESAQHFFGVCPALSQIRWSAFGKRTLTQIEIINVLDGNICSWNHLARYIQNALKTRTRLISERA
jgi:hypothetical protein